MGLFTKNVPAEIADRVPPGQRLVKSWPVLHYGPVPRFDGTDWDLEVSGLVDHPFTLSYEELRDLPNVTVDADMHCVTGWTTLDNTWEGVSFRTIMDLAKPQAEAKWVIAHCAYGYTSNLSLEAMAEDDVLVAWRNHGEDLDARARVAAASRRPEAIRVEEREVAHGPGVQREEHAGLLGGPRLPHPRRALRRGAVHLPGGPRGRARALGRLRAPGAGRCRRHAVRRRPASRARRPSRRPRDGRGSRASPRDRCARPRCSRGDPGVPPGGTSSRSHGRARHAP